MAWMDAQYAAHAAHAVDPSVLDAWRLAGGLRSRGVRARDEPNDLHRALSPRDVLVQKKELLAGGLVHGVHPHERAPVDSEVRMGSEGSESLDRIEAPRGSLTNRKRRIDR